LLFIGRDSVSNIDPVPNVNKIGSEVYHLVSQLPSRMYHVYNKIFFFYKKYNVKGTT